VGELYGLLATRLEQIVRLDVRAPDAVIEDACQFAWSRLVHHADRVRRETALSWLAKTAVHEAFKLIRREDRELSLDDDAGCPAEAMLRSRTPGPHELVEYRERLADVAALPHRQQRMVWLHAAGLSYNDISACEGCTVRTVERQLSRAKRALRAAQERAEDLAQDEQRRSRRTAGRDPRLEPHAERVRRANERT
jgi:RNA polymerase sigma factor (sigma-70 family)